MLLAFSRIKLNTVDSDGFTVLHLAAENRNTDMTSLLLAKGCCRFVRDSWGRTALDIALEQSITNNVCSTLGLGTQGVLNAFRSGVDYWQRKRHRAYSRAMQQASSSLVSFCHLWCGGA